MEMALNMPELRLRLSSIEGDPQMYVDLGPDEVPLLVELLNDEEAWMASRAVYALTRIATPEAVDAIHEASASPRGEVRVAVAASANLLPVPEADQVLTRLLADPDVGVRKYAIGSVMPDSDASLKQLVMDISDSDDAVLKGTAASRARDLGL